MQNSLLVVTLALPLLWLVSYGTLLVAQFRVGERVPVIGLKGLLGLLFVAYVALIYLGEAHTRWPKWIEVTGNYEFPLEFHFTRPMGAAMLGMLMLMSVIVKYSESYLHKEVGFHRFFFLLSIFLSMTPFVLFADNIDVLFMGWELIGVTSVLLIGFYEHRESPTINSWWAMGTYRLCDMGLLIATSLAHYAVHTTNLQQLNQPHALAQLHPEHAGWLVAVAISMVIASMGKAAQWPLTSWVTRAMEGPTPSSALYYGALSISLGPLLLLKMQGLILAYPFVQALVIGVGCVSALYVFLIAKVRSDAKSILVLSSVFEVSIMVIEVGLGLYHWVIFHFLAHAALRTFQFLRSMNAIHDFYTNPLFFRGAQLKGAPWPLNWLPAGLRKQLYYRALEGFGLDNFIANGLVRRWFAVITKLNSWEEKALRKNDERGF